MGFPNAAGATDFLRAFRAVVYPSDWKSLNEKALPPVLLRTGGEGEGAAQRSARVLDALENSLRLPDCRAVPYARPQRPASATPGSALLTLRVGAELPRDPLKRTGRLKLRDFNLVAELVEGARRLAEQDRAALSDQELQDRLVGRALRDDLYALRAQDPDGVPHTLAQPPPEGMNVVLALILRVVARPLFYRLPRRLWAWRWKRRLLTSRRYGWYRKWLNLAHTHGSFFDRVSEVLTAQSTALRGNEQDRQNALLEMEKLLLRALMADLHRARSGRWGPWKRRRRTRRVVLLDLPAASTPGGQDAVRFLQAYRSVCRAPGASSLCLIGAGLPDGYPEVAGQRWHLEQTEGLAAVAQYLRASAPGDERDGDPRLLQPALDDDAFRGVGLAVAPLHPAVPPIGPRAESALAVALAVLLVAAPIAFVPWFSPDSSPDMHCLDGSVADGTIDPERLRNVALERGGLRKENDKAAYDAVVRQIEGLKNKQSNNQQARAAEKDGFTVRKVVYLGSSVSADPGRGEFNGAVAELRGVWLAQTRLNGEAAQDPQKEKVQLVVDVRDTGKDFENAAEEAAKVVAEARKNAKHHDHRTIVGVVGFAESRDRTQSAARILSKGKVPVLSTTATADAMQEAGPYYRPLAPSNERESRIAAEFARSGSVVEETDDAKKTTGYCQTAKQAVVVKDPRDLYSDEIGSKFVKHFTGTTHTIEYPGGAANGMDTAKRICAFRKEERRTVVYWASRVESFNTFLDNFNNTGCAYQTLTVIGGNELTNAAMAGEYNFARDWLRLYHTAHILPVGHEEMNGEAQRFAANYSYYAGDNDPWLSDGHGPLGFDALRVLGRAADDANASVRNEVTASAVKSKLDNELRLEGASGAIHYREGNVGSKPPVDKGFVIERYTKDGPSLVLHCGTFSLNKPSVETWGPNDLSCPKDK
ncbi:hypothetical protein [Streptomyces sp. NPDC015345]|uniref:hypothetical protein n=1 Tax=Streptomyces sp. NPDC015345 TaxID=3364953 RepID=UPI0036F81442